MSIFDWLEERLGINDIEKRLSEVEIKTDRLEEEMDAMRSDLTGFRGFKDRTKEELHYMRGQIENMLAPSNAWFKFKKIRNTWRTPRDFSVE